MSQLKRYDLVGRRENGYAVSTVEEHPSGCFVKFEDYMNLLGEKNKLRNHIDSSLAKQIHNIPAIMSGGLENPR